MGFRKNEYWKANETGYYYQIGLYLIKGLNSIKLPFEFAFCEGDIEKII